MGSRGHLAALGSVLLVLPQPPHQHAASLWGSEPAPPSSVRPHRDPPAGGASESGDIIGAPPLPAPTSGEFPIFTTGEDEDAQDEEDGGGYQAPLAQGVVIVSEDFFLALAGS